MTQHIEHTRQLLGSVREQMMECFKEHALLRARMELILDKLETAHHAAAHDEFTLQLVSARAALRGEC